MQEQRTSVRARVRAEMTEEIKAIARRQLAEQGASNLSLRAVAREVGLVSSAVYRYFASRDELLTALIMDAYNSLGEAAEQADAGVERGDLIGRFEAVCRAVRQWALDNPHEFALTYGTPGARLRRPAGHGRPGHPGHHPAGPAPGRRGRCRRAADPGGRVAAAGGERRDEPDRRHDVPGRPADGDRAGLIVWTLLFGAISFELFGRMVNVIDDREAWFAYQVTSMARFVGLRP
jgi:AcrR family transcriptional regulator